MMMQDIQAKR